MNTNADLMKEKLLSISERDQLAVFDSLIFELFVNKLWDNKVDPGDLLEFIEYRIGQYKED